MLSTVKLDEHKPAWVQSKCIYNENSPLFYHCCAGSQYENTDHRSAEIRFYSQTHQRLQTWFIHAAHERFNKGFAFLLHEKWFQASFKYTHGCVFYLQSPQCWNHNHVNTYESNENTPQNNRNERSRFKYHSKGLNTSVCAIFMVQFSFVLFNLFVKSVKYSCLFAIRGY